MSTPETITITISEHCIDRYLERVAPASLRRNPSARRQALLELTLALRQKPLCLLPCGEGWLVGVQNAFHHRFMVKLDATRTVAETCGPIWFWHEARKHWRQAGIDPKKVSKGRTKPGAGMLARLGENYDPARAGRGEKTA